MADNLVVSGIKLDSRDLVKGVNQAEQYLRKLETRVKTLEGKTQKASMAMSGMGRKVGKLFAGFAGFMIVKRATKAIIEINREFQQLEVQLKTVTGSVSDAEIAFDMIKEFTAKTPFQIQQVTQAFVQLAAFGLKPTSEQMRGLGNMAAAFSRDITEITNATVSAANGMIRPLRRFGIMAKVEGDRANVTFRGVTHTIDRTVEAFTELVASFGNQQFGGAMADQMETLNGIISNLKDNTALFSDKVGKAGLNQELSELLKMIRDNVAEGDEFAETLGRTMGTSVDILTVGVEALFKHFELLIMAMQAVISIKVARAMMSITRATYVMITAQKAAIITAGSLRVALAAISWTTVAGGAVMAAAAIGGPLLFKMLSAKDAAKTLGESIAEVQENLKNLDPRKFESAIETIMASIARMEEERPGLKILAGTPEARAGFDKQQPIENVGDMLVRNYLLQQERLEMLLMLQEQYQESLDFEKTIQLSQATEKLIQKFEAETIALRDGEAALLEYQMSMQGLDEEQKELVRNAQRLYQVEVDAAEQREVAKNTLEENQRAVEDMIDSLKDQEAALNNTTAELVMMELVSKKATESEIEQARALLASIAALEAKAVAAEKTAAAMDKAFQIRLAEYEAEQNKVKETADQMAEAFTDFAMDVISDFDRIEIAFGELMDALAREILKLYLRKQVTEPLTDWLMTGLGMVGFGSAKPGTATPGAYAGDIPIKGPLFPSVLPDLPVIGFPSPTAGGGGGGVVGGGVAPEIVPTAGGVGGGNSVQPLVVEQQINFNVSAIDQRGVDQFFRQNKAMVAATAADGIRQSRALQAEILRR